jgi:hypothetical protein
MTDGLTVHLREKIRTCWCRGQRKDGIVAGIEGTHTPHCLETVECARRFTQSDGTAVGSSLPYTVMQPVRQLKTALFAAMGTNTWFVPE